MWIAKDKDKNVVTLFENRPVKNESWDVWVDMKWADKGHELCYIGNLPENMFPNLKWEDEPIEVEIVSKKFMDMWRAKNNVMLQMFEDDSSKKENDCNNCIHATDITDKDCFCKSLKSYVHFPQKDCGRRKPHEPITDEDIWNIM